MTLPFGWALSIGYFITPVVVLILYALASLELIAEEMENPFGTDTNNLPISRPDLPQYSQACKRVAKLAWQQKSQEQKN